EDKAANALADGGRETIAGVLPKLEAVETWEAASLEAAVRAHAEETGLKLGKLAQPLRAAATGRSVSPGVFDVLAVLGREEALARLKDQAA
ncbi:MAG: glutamate--tRNA ligase, partial [Fulvimarina manganoxydans]|nr:glutamate--tRNA ligase [Fulvimarina manganoxydans]